MTTKQNGTMALTDDQLNAVAGGITMWTLNKWGKLDPYYGANKGLWPK